MLPNTSVSTNQPQKNVVSTIVIPNQEMFEESRKKRENEIITDALKRYFKSFRFAILKKK